MSQRTLRLERPPVRRAAVAAPVSPRREAWMRAGAVAGTLALMVAIAFDLMSGRWIGDAGLHLVLVLSALVLWMPAARKVPYLHFGPVYMAGLFVYTVLRSFADETALPIHTYYVIDIDRALFLGHAPTLWLQERLFDPTQLRPLDWLTVQVHWSYFAVPHVAALLVWVWRRELFPRFVAVVLGTFYAGLGLYFLLPTVPPWLAADHGVLPGVTRVMDFVGGHVDTANYSRMYDALGVPNAVAAMPSLHMGVTFALFLFARQINRWLGRFLLVYSVVMGFSLVYMGEHYVADVLVGMLVAFAVFKLVHYFSGPLPQRHGTPVYERWRS